MMLRSRSTSLPGFLLSCLGLSNHLLLSVLALNTAAPRAGASQSTYSAPGHSRINERLASHFGMPTQTQSEGPESQGTAQPDLIKPALVSSGAELLLGIDHLETGNELIAASSEGSGNSVHLNRIDKAGNQVRYSPDIALRERTSFAIVRDTIGGFAPGTAFVGTADPGGITLIHPDGSTIESSWVKLPSESGQVDRGLWLDRTGVYDGDLIAVTSLGNVWRITSHGVPKLLASLGTNLHGVATLPQDSQRYGPWAGRIIVGDTQLGGIHAIDAKGVAVFYPLGLIPRDIAVVRINENLYGIASGGKEIWGVRASDLDGMTGDVLIAQKSPGALSRIRWSGASFETTAISEAGDWAKVAFSTAGIGEIPAISQADNRALVRHAPVVSGGRVEGSLWQLSAEDFSVSSSSTITGDLLVPGTPRVTKTGNATMAGTSAGSGNAEPSGFSVKLSGNAALRTVITRTDPIDPPTVTPPLAPPAGTRDVSLTNAGDSLGDPHTLRDLKLGGKAGAVSVPPGAYGAFTAEDSAAFVFGVTSTTQPAVYNLQSLALRGEAQLQLLGPVVITVAGPVALSGSAEMGAQADPRWLTLRMAGGALDIGGDSMLYAIVRAPSSVVTIGGGSQLVGALSCDRLVVDGNSLLRLAIANQPPKVSAGPNQMLELPVDTVNLNGKASDDGLPGDILTLSWSKLSGPDVVAFGDPAAAVTTARFLTAGSYTLRLTAYDGQLSSTSDVTVKVYPPNQPPLVDAGPSRTITLPATATLNGTVTDDGLPLGRTLTMSWSKVSGPGTVAFSSPNAASTTASFGMAGAYVLRLTANDSQYPAGSNVAVTVKPANQPPTVEAGADQTFTLPATAQLSGSAADDGLPEGSALAVTWSKLQGPADVVFENAHGATTTATFSKDGVYLLQLAVTDGVYTVVDTLSVTVKPEPGQTLPPDPATVAPPLDPTIATTMEDAVKFLYTGPNPIQQGVQPGVLSPVRLAVVKGKVFDRSGAPLPGVRMTILNHPEYGHTLSRLDGGYDMAVNGGGRLTLNMEKAGFLPVQRPVDARWQDYALIDETRMVALDTAVTAVDLASAGIQVARSSVITDADGTRRATMLFSPGTTATMKLPDGSSQTLSTLHVRATEYSVGPDGQKAMPALLPPSSAYTYAAEFSADEALAVGASEVQFSKPVIVYVDNFLRFPAGTIVPVGYYDRAKGLWIASESGRVIKIVAIANGLADADTNGDNIADNDPALGITEAERQQLAALYAVGQSLWRAQITHFSPWDCNWSMFPPADATGPGQPKPIVEKSLSDPCESHGSIIECQNQVLGERVNVVGTPFTLNYRSDRMPGHRTGSQVKISASGGSMPASLLRIEVHVQVAGREFSWTLGPLPNQNVDMVWDGKDAYGRPQHGELAIDIDICYVYSAVYMETDRFGGIGNSAPITGDRARNELTLHQRFSEVITSPLFSSNQVQGFGGWSLDVHHIYDPVGRILLKGDGTRQSAGITNYIFNTAVGGGDPAAAGVEEIPATQAYVKGSYEEAYPDLAVGSDGSLYFVDYGIRKVDPDGIVHRVAGNGNWCESGPACGEDIPAVQAPMSPDSFTVGPDGTLYILTWDLRVLMIGPDGILRRIAGDGTPCTYSAQNKCGDGGPALMGRFAGFAPNGIALGLDGAIYIGDLDNYRIRRIGADGRIDTVAGNGSPFFSGDGGPAIQAGLGWMMSVTVGADGSLYVSDTRRVRRISPDGMIRTIAGGGSSNDDGIPALQASLSPLDVDVMPDGSLLVNNSSRLRVIGPDGIIHTVAGGGGLPFTDGIPAGQIYTHGFHSAAAPDGSFYARTSFKGQAIVVHGRSLFPGITIGTVRIASEDGGEVYEFDSHGRHLRTLNAFTLAVLQEFAYTPEGLLASITDGDHNTTTVQRDGQGRPLAIIAPFGQRTDLTLDPNGFLASITDPELHAVTLTYTADGLLKRFKDPNLHESLLDYDGMGRLTKDQDAAAGFQDLDRTMTQSDDTVTITTAMGRKTIYRTSGVFKGASNREYIYPDNTKMTQIIKGDDSVTTVTADGVQSTETDGQDPRFGMQVPYPALDRIRMPSGLTRTASMVKTATYTSPSDPLSLRLTTSMSVNGRSFTSVYDGVARTFTNTTPQGRQSSRVVDAHGRLTSMQTAGLDPVTYSYEARGRLASMTQGTGLNQRVTSYSYNANGYLEKVTDSLNRVMRFEYDGAGRVKNQWLPNGRVVAYSYDAAGNLTRVTPPSRPAHEFSYTPVNLTAAYTPPGVAGTGTNVTTYQYNLDKQPTLVTRPDGQTISFSYDTGGRLSATTTPAGQYVTSYDGAGRVSGISAPGGQMLGYTYDGSLPLSAIWSGAFNASVSRTFDNNFWVKTQSVSGGNTLNFTYDNDGLLTGAGSLSLTRDPQNGLLTGTTFGAVSDVWTYNSFGEPKGYSATTSGVAAYSVTYTRDKLGRITDKSETTAGTAVAWHYDYDLAGRLTDVQQNGTLVSHYEYDGNGNRTRAQYPALAADLTGSYDAQDRMLSYGANTYSYAANGELLSKTNANGTTVYNYDVLGNLRSATLPGGTVIENVIDGQNRRIGKKVNGTLTQGFVYDGQLQIVAELDGAGNVASRFVYADRANVPAYMVKGGITYRIIADQLGSPRLVITTTTGAIAQRIDYDEFGNILADTNPGFQPFAFAGGLHDQHTRLIRFGARDFDPESGRWAAKDPIAFSGGTPNLYGYNMNEPVNSIDINGLWKDSGHLSLTVNAMRGFFGLDFSATDIAQSVISNLAVDST